MNYKMLIIVAVGIIVSCITLGSIILPKQQKEIKPVVTETLKSVCDCPVTIATTTVLVSNEITNCEKLGGKLTMYYSDFNNKYRMFCKTEEKYLFEKYIK